MHKLAIASVVTLATLTACGKKESAPAQNQTATTAVTQEAPAAPPPVDPNNIVAIAAGSKDHTTLVAALKAADYITAISNPGPFTVFAPTDAAFAKLPPGTVEELVKPAKQAELKEVLKYHATTTAYEAKDLKDGMVLGMANGGKVTIKVAPDGSITVNDAKIIASVRASNGALHIIDTVLLPPAK